jgi:hypothetical protein
MQHVLGRASVARAPLTGSQLLHLLRQRRLLLLLLLLQGCAHLWHVPQLVRLVAWLLAFLLEPLLLLLLLWWRCGHDWRHVPQVLWVAALLLLLCWWRHHGWWHVPHALSGAALLLLDPLA